MVRGRRGGLFSAAGHTGDTQDQEGNLLRDFFIAFGIQQKAGSARFRKRSHDAAPLLQARGLLFPGMPQADDTYILYLRFCSGHKPPRLLNPVESGMPLPVAALQTYTTARLIWLP